MPAGALQSCRGWRSSGPSTQHCPVLGFLALSSFSPLGASIPDPGVQTGRIHFRFLFLPSIFPRWNPPACTPSGSLSASPAFQKPLGDVVRGRAPLGRLSWLQTVPGCTAAPSPAHPTYRRTQLGRVWSPCLLSSLNDGQQLCSLCPLMPAPSLLASPALSVRSGKSSTVIKLIGA